MHAIYVRTHVHTLRIRNDMTSIVDNTLKMLVGLLLLTCTLQLHLSLGRAPSGADTTLEPCREANYESGCQDGVCEFSVSWRRREAIDQSIVIKLISLIPELKETDVWTAGLSFIGNDKLKGELKCQWSTHETSYNNYCSVGREGGGGDTVGCMTANTTYHSHLMECWFVLSENSVWSDLFSSPVSIHITRGNASGSLNTTLCQCHIDDCHSSCDYCTLLTPADICHSSFALLLIRSHAILMVLTFLLLLPTGVLISRYARPIYPHSWFKSHAVTNSTGVMLMILGLMCVLGHTGGSFSMGFHQMVGIICISLVLFQALCGFLRPATGVSLQRHIFTYVHKTVGAIILGLGSLALILGGIMYQNSVYVIVIAVLVTAIVMEGVLMIIMEVITRKNQIILPPVGYHRVKGDGEGEGEGKDVEELYVKEKRGEGERKPMGTILHKRKALHGHTVTKRLLIGFIAQAFLFSCVVGILLAYGSH